MTLVPTRKTPAGQEYWDKVNKKSVLYPHGSEPEDIQTEGMVGLYSTAGQLADGIKTALQSGEIIIPQNKEGSTEGELTVAEMDIEQLRKHAEENGIEIPGNMKKLETIRQHIIEELNAAADAQ